MAYDTVKLKSPGMSPDMVRYIENQCIKRSGIDMATGTMLYELFAGDLSGSWDSRISLKPMWDDWCLDKNNRPVLQRAPFPYIVVEASVHKIRCGHNVYGGPDQFHESVTFLVDLLSRLLGIPLPCVDNWTVHRVDVANVYALSRKASKEFFDSIQLRNFPRRQKKAAKYDMAVYFPGKTTTVKFYHKGDEFKLHDMNRLRSFFAHVFHQIHGHDPQNKNRVERKLIALHRLADNRLRVEVEIHADKLQYDFGYHPKVSEITDEYLNTVHDKEVERLLREGKQSMETVRTTTAVLNRLHYVYGQNTGSRLYGFWCSLTTLNENVVRDKYAKTVFYRNRKLLEDAGVSWRSSDIHVTANDSLVHDFVPSRFDRRFCSLPARNRPEFEISRKVA